MPSSYTPSLRLEQQFTGENINIWGVLLNAVIARLDSSVAALRTIALTGNYTLTTANGTDDEARNAIIKTTGGGPFTVTIPSVSKTYYWFNACTAVVTVTTGGGSTVDVGVGETCVILCDGSNVKRVFSRNMDGQRLTNLGSPTSATDAATKKYVDDTAFALNAGQLPGQIGSGGLFLTTNGSVASWAPVAIGNTVLFESNAVSFFALQAGGQRVVGLYGGTDGGLGLINTNSQWRLKTFADGTAFTVTDAGASYSIVTSNTVSSYTAPLAANVATLAAGYETIQVLTAANVGSPTSAVLTIDLSQGTAFTHVLSKNISNVAYLNAPAAGIRKSWTLTFIGNTTANTVTWTHNANTWAGTVSQQSAPVINTTVNVHTTLTQWTDDGGAHVHSVKGGES